MTLGYFVTLWLSTLRDREIVTFDFSTPKSYVRFRGWNVKGQDHRITKYTKNHTVINYLKKRIEGDRVAGVSYALWRVPSRMLLFKCSCCFLIWWKSKSFAPLLQVSLGRPNHKRRGWACMLTDVWGPITCRSFPREAFPRDDPQKYVSAHESDPAHC